MKRKTTKIKNKKSDITKENLKSSYFSYIDEEK